MTTTPHTTPAIAFSDRVMEVFRAIYGPAQGDVLDSVRLASAQAFTELAAPAPAAPAPQIEWDEVFDCAVYSWCRSSKSQEMLRMCFQSRNQQDQVSVGWTANELMSFAKGIVGIVTAAPKAPSAQDADRPHGFVKPDTGTHVYFYEQDFYVLSNFSAFTLYWDGVENMRFDTSEAAYHWEKFPGHDDIRAAIINAPSAHEAFKVAERNKAHRRPDWDDVKVDVMRRILRAKAEQHEYVRRKLLATGNRTLVEDSWRDAVWGWGPNRDGQNLLGKLWMEVRAELRAQQKGGA